MKWTITVAALLLAGCGTQYYACKIPERNTWRALPEIPSKAKDALAADVKIEQRLLSEKKVNWFEGPEGTLLACVPGAAEGPCASSAFFREH